MNYFWKQFSESEEGFTLVELMIVVAIIGILAAIAIPQFMDSVQNAKSAEAKQIMKKISEGSKGYFSTEQKITPSSGDEPWHSSYGTPGLPIEFSSYVYPGGAGFTYNVIGGSSADIPDGGSKKNPAEPASVSNEAKAAASWWGLELEDPLYFEYTYESKSSGPGANATLRARANFTTGDSTYHTYTQNLSVVDGEPQINPAYESNTGE